MLLARWPSARISPYLLRNSFSRFEFPLQIAGGWFWCLAGDPTDTCHHLSTTPLNRLLPHGSAPALGLGLGTENMCEAEGLGPTPPIHDGIRAPTTDTGTATVSSEALAASTHRRGQG